MSAILRMFKVPLQSALFNPAITDSFDAAPSPSAESPYRRASGVLSHALKSCDSVKGSLWQGVSRTHTLLSLAGIHFFFLLLKWAWKKKQKRTCDLTMLHVLRFLEKLLFKSYQESRRIGRHERISNWRFDERVQKLSISLQMSVWKQCFQWINTISVFSNCGPLLGGSSVSACCCGSHDAASLIRVY